MKRVIKEFLASMLVGAGFTFGIVIASEIVNVFK